MSAAPVISVSQLLTVGGAKSDRETAMITTRAVTIECASYNENKTRQRTCAKENEPKRRKVHHWWTCRFEKVHHWWTCRLGTTWPIWGDKGKTHQTTQAFPKVTEHRYNAPSHFHGPLSRQSRHSPVVRMNQTRTCSAIFYIARPRSANNADMRLVLSRICNLGRTQIK